MVIRDRYIAEMRLEDIFLCSCNSHVLVDYNDILAIRRNHTLRVLYSYTIELKDIDELKLVLQEVSLEDMSYCALEIAYSEGLTFAELDAVTRIIHNKLQELPCLNCNHLSKNIAGGFTCVNLYVFSPKVKEDRDKDYRVEKILKSYHMIRTPQHMFISQINGVTDLNDIQISLRDDETDADSRLTSYTGVIRYLTVNDNSYMVIKELVEEAVKYLEHDGECSTNLTIPTVQEFAFYAGNLWIHLNGYFPEEELKPTALKWSALLHEMRVNSPGYLKEATDLANMIRDKWIENISITELNIILESCRNLAARGNDTNRAALFSALEKLSRSAYYVQDMVKCNSISEVAMEIGKNENPEIPYREYRLRTFEDLINERIQLKRNDTQQ